jgi:hypothetical protein
VRERPRDDIVSRAAIVFALAMICYTANGKTLGAGDTLPARYLPFAVLRHGSFYLDEFHFLYREGRPYYLIRSKDDHYLSFYPVGAALAALPFYIPAVLEGAKPEDPRSKELEKLASASIVALSVAVLYATLVQTTSGGSALAITLAYALGTSSLSTSSQALWQHGPAQLGLSVGVALLVWARRHSPWLAGLAGFPLAFAVVCRPTNLLVSVPIAAFALIAYRRQAVLLIATASIPLVFQLVYNVAYFGDPLWSPAPVSDFRWRGQMSRTLPGLLLSPSRGLFVYSPVLLFSLAGIALSLRKRGDPLVRAIGAGVLLDLLLYARWWEWWGGGSHGPRLLADVTPLLCFAIYPCMDLVRRSVIARAVFVVTLLWSVAAHAAGAYWDDRSWNVKLQGAERPTILWSWTNNQLANSLRDVARLSATRLLGAAVPADQGRVTQLRETICHDPPDDRAFLELRELYRSAGDTDAAERIEMKRRQRFTPSRTLGWRFDDALTLLGVDARSFGSDAVEIVYYWRAERGMADDYAVYTRLVGRGCGLASDYVLGAPGHPTSRWVAGETLRQRQVVSIPARLAASGCSLHAGVWSPRDRHHLYIRRLPLWQKMGAVLAIQTAASGLRFSRGTGP